MQGAAGSTVSSTEPVGHLAKARERALPGDLKTETGEVRSQYRNECRIAVQAQRGRTWGNSCYSHKKRVEDAKINLLFCPCLELNFQGHPSDEMISQRQKIHSTSV